MDKRWLGNINVNVLTTVESINHIRENLIQKKPTNIFFLNDHGYNIAQKDAQYRTILNDADFLLNDGIGIEIGAKLFGFEFKENLNGTDFIPAFFHRLNEEMEQKYRIFLLGAKPGIAEKARVKLQEQFSNLQFVGAQDGYFKEEDTDQVIEEINQLQTDILLVGFGMPLQEMWINENRDKLNCSLVFAVGAFLDFSSGVVQRAPKLFIQLRLEWLYRMLKEPRRLWKRNVVGHLAFFYSMFKQKRRKQKGI